MISVPILFVTSLEEARGLLKDPTPKLLALIPEDELLAHAALLTDIASDFDGTMVEGSQWKEIDRQLPKPIQEEIEQTRNWWFSLSYGSDTDLRPINGDWFHGHIHEDNIPVAESAWVYNTIRLYEKGGLTRAHFTEAGRLLKGRLGVHELFALMRKRVVISMGIEQPIEAWLETNRITASVAASRLFFKDDRVSGAHFNIVVGATKRLAVEKFKDHHQLTGKRLLVAGDSIIDESMMDHESFNVFVMPHTSDDARMHTFRDRHLPIMWHKLTLIIHGNELIPLVELILTARALKPLATTSS